MFFCHRAPRIESAKVLIWVCFVNQWRKMSHFYGSPRWLETEGGMIRKRQLNCTTTIPCLLFMVSLMFANIFQVFSILSPVSVCCCASIFFSYLIFAKEWREWANTRTRERTLIQIKMQMTAQLKLLSFHAWIVLCLQVWMILVVKSLLAPALVASPPQWVLVKCLWQPKEPMEATNKGEAEPDEFERSWLKNSSVYSKAATQPIPDLTLWWRNNWWKWQACLQELSGSGFRTSAAKTRKRWACKRAR